MPRWRCLEDILKTSFVFVFKRHLQDVLKASCSRRTYSPYLYVFRWCLQDVFKTSWPRPIYSSWSFVFKTSSRRFQEVFKTSARRLAKRSSGQLQDVFKTFWRRLAKKSSEKMYSKTIFFRSVLLLLDQIIIYAYGRI